MSDKTAGPLNAFSTEYLAAAREQEDSATALEAETSGPLKLEEAEGRFALLNLWESLEAGDAPQAVLFNRETALLFQAIWPAVGRSRMIWMANDGGPEGFAVEQEAAGVVGRLKSFLPEASFAAHVAAYLARTPYQLSLLIDAAGPEAQRMLGRILAERVLRGGRK
jgi:hypothetical protein